MLSCTLGFPDFSGRVSLRSCDVFFRLHEFDEQVAAVREGMARVVPVPLLSLFTGYELETMVRALTHTRTHTLSLSQWISMSC